MNRKDGVVYMKYNIHLEDYCHDDGGTIHNMYTTANNGVVATSQCVTAPFVPHTISHVNRIPVYNGIRLPMVTGSIGKTGGIVYYNISDPTDTLWDFVKSHNGITEPKTAIEKLRLIYDILSESEFLDETGEDPAF